MKNLFIALTLTIASLAAHAEDYGIVAGPKMYTATLTHARVSPDDEQMVGVSGGDISILPGKKEITLHLSRNSYCAPGKYCNMLYRLPVAITVKLVQSNSINGKTIYIGQSNHSADKMDVEIEVIASESDTKVIVKKSNSEASDRVLKSTFTGTRLNQVVY